MYSVELLVDPVGPQVTPTHANFVEVGSGAGDSARVPGSEMTAAGALDPDSGTTENVSAARASRLDEEDRLTIVREHDLLVRAAWHLAGLMERIREPLTVEYTPTPPLPSPATNSAGAGWRFPCGGVHLGKPTCGRGLCRGTPELRETTKTRPSDTTTTRTIPMNQRRCRRRRASGNSASGSSRAG